jgi:phage tail sheath protein FI
MKGGSLGSLVTVSDLVNGINKMRNREETPIKLFMDGGWTHPAVAQAINQLAAAQGTCHGYLSSDINAELAANYKGAIVDYKASLNINAATSSLFTGWTKFLDTYNQKEVWISPECFAAASQAYTERNFNMFTPAAGWERGRVEALDVLVKYSEGDRDYFVDNRINPVRYKKGEGMAIWGNETLLSKPSPMQMRHVAMLLIVIEEGLQALEWQTFNLNNESTWIKVEASLNAFMRDEIKAKGGVYNYQVALQEIITASDLDNRRMPIFLGIQPTSDIQLIPVTLAVFNNTVSISID